MFDTFDGGTGTSTTTERTTPSAVAPSAGSIQPDELQWDEFEWADDRWSAEEWARLTVAALAEWGDDESSPGLPAGLDGMAPDVVMAAILSQIDVAELSGYDRVVALRAHQRLASHFAALVFDDMAAIADVYQSDEFDFDAELAEGAAAAEIRAALRLTRRAADHQLDMALDLRRRLPHLWEALAAGDLDPRRATTILAGVGHLPDDTAREVVDRVLDEAAGLTTGQIRARLRRLCIETDPDEAQERYHEAVADRRVVAQATEAGTAHLLLLELPPDRVAAIRGRIDQLATRLRTRDETRTMDQLRADIVLDLLDGNGYSGRGRGRGVVDITVDLATLLRLADTPGELGGYGPVVADLARQVAEENLDAEWRYTITDADNGQLLHNGATRRRPTAQQRRRVHARDRTCTFPGCRAPATGCDLDHRIPYAHGGPTVTHNLGPVCPHDHDLRHQYGWTYRPIPRGDYLWTSPLGHTYTTSGKPP